jgi:hypothetical protein
MALYSWPVAILIVENLEIRSGAPVFLRIRFSVEKVLAFNAAGRPQRGTIRVW